MSQRNNVFYVDFHIKKSKQTKNRQYRVIFWNKTRDWAKITIFATDKKECRGFASHIKKMLVRIGQLPGRVRTDITLWDD